MPTKHLPKRAAEYLNKLTVEISNRRVGSEGNRAATDYFAEVVADFGFETGTPQFDCMDWRHGEVRLAVGEQSFEVFASPYSLGCQVSAPLIAAASVEELIGIEVQEEVLLLRGEIAKEQLMPKNFTFYNPEHHQQIVKLLETKAPQAIIAATSRDPGLAGGLYPFPLIEDGDFDIPSVYMTDVVGDRLVENVGREVTLVSAAERIPSTGCNVIARKGGGSGRKMVVCAHIDAKIDSPGAIDNGGGVVVLMLLAELLAGYRGDLEVEIVAFNGEDYYSAPGQVDYLQTNQDRFNQIMLAVNLDGVGYIEGMTAYSLYACPDETSGAAHKAFSAYTDILEGQQWYQSDHMIFVQGGKPAMAITSEKFEWLSTYITHTEKDVLEIVDSDKLANAAQGLKDLVRELNKVEPG